jgi:hypothetical protein
MTMEICMVRGGGDELKTLVGLTNFSVLSQYMI